MSERTVAEHVKWTIHATRIHIGQSPEGDSMVTSASCLDPVSGVRCVIETDPDDWVAAGRIYEVFDGTYTRFVQPQEVQS